MCCSDRAEILLQLCCCHYLLLLRCLDDSVPSQKLCSVRCQRRTSLQVSVSPQSTTGPGRYFFGTALISEMDLLQRDNV